MIHYSGKILTILYIIAIMMGYFIYNNKINEILENYRNRDKYDKAWDRLKIFLDNYRADIYVNSKKSELDNAQFLNYALFIKDYRSYINKFFNESLKNQLYDIYSDDASISHNVFDTKESYALSVVANVYHEYKGKCLYYNWVLFFLLLMSIILVWCFNTL